MDFPDLQSVVADWYQRPLRPECGCRDTNGNPLVLQIRRTEAAQGMSAVYRLASMPYQAMLHRKTCSFHSDAGSTRTITDTDTLEPIRKVTDNNQSLLDIKLDVSLGIDRLVEGNQASAARTRTRTGAGVSQRRSITLLGLLRTLWEQAELNRWSVSQIKARWPRVSSARLYEAMASVVCNEKALSEVGLIMRSGIGLLPEQAVGLTEACRKTSSRALLISVLREPPKKRKDGDDYTLVLDGAREANIIPVISADHLGNWAERFPTEAALLRPQTGQGQNSRCDLSKGAVFFIGTARMNLWNRPSKDRGNASSESQAPLCFANIEQYALMATTGDGSLIPVDSLYEKHVAEKLMVAKRCFVKPQQLMLSAPGTLGLPDFILKDANEAEHYVMEVFGRSLDDTRYQVRKRQKISHYNQTAGEDGWWYWDLTETQVMPPFPRKLEGEETIESS